MEQNGLIKYIFLLISISLIVLSLAYFSMTNGVYPITFQEFYHSIFRISLHEDIDLLLFDFRLPRVILAMIIGFGLGISGSVLQGITKNGLADPGILGINSGAGAAIVIYMFFFQESISDDSITAIMMMPMAGLVGGLLAAFIIFFIAADSNRLDAQRLLLTGIAISSGFGALSLYLSLKMKSQDFEMATIWLNGSIYSANWLFILSILPWFILIIPLIIKKAYILDLFTLQEEVLKGLGVKVEKEKWILLLSSVAIVSACVSVAGNIGFIGLIGPHIAKLLIGKKHRYSLIICGMIGMLLMVAADYISRTIVAPAELSIGIILSIIGVPYFVYLLIKAKV
ncbi:FecCD family ABC transporter permease [Niallia nealsonii]|uniref:Iron ABC transporter permease n=1 Tax=Niallia nealsonii TaxID=115979 RepID=A0A2N0Z7E0_9BACI|nr:iron ABC transporter permease [Niallia nealsonii]PKG25420.1 iron ABC transporter permease [Niallia nealsonii]